MSDIVWRLVNICYEVTVALEAYETQEEPNAELAEVKQTVQRYLSPLHARTHSHNDDIAHAIVIITTTLSLVRP